MKPVDLPLGIRGRLTIWFVLGAVGAVVFGSVVVYVTGVTSIQGSLGQTYCQIASRIAGQFENQFTQESAVTRNIATDVLTTEVAMEADRRFRRDDDDRLMDRIAAMIREWDETDGAKGRTKLLHPQLSHRLQVLAELRSNAVKRLSVYDTRGLALASSDVPERRSALGEAWFDAVLKQDRHFTFLDLDRDLGELRIVIPVWGGVDIVGYVVGDYNYPAFASSIETISFGDTGEVVVVDYAGVPLAGEPRQFLIQALGVRQEAAAGDAGWTTPYWVPLAREKEWPLWQRLACVAPLATVNSLRGRFGLPPWAIVVTQAPSESYAPMRDSLSSFAVAGFIGVFVVGFGGAFIAWHIASPLKELQEGVRRFARGERDRPVEVSSTDEIGELAAEFNRMAVRVSASENELRAFAQAVEHATDAIVMTAPDATIYYANPAFERVTGYGREDVKGQDPSLLKSGRTPAETYRTMWQSISRGAPWRGELWNKRASGEIYPVDLSISPIHDEDGKVVSLLGIHRDITLAREYQEKLETEVKARTREIAETQGLTAMGRMASMIAHDLRNALSTIKMNLQLLFRKHSDSGGVEEQYCEMGLDQVRYMEEIVRDMLSFARPERMRADWHAIGKIIDEALAADALLIQEKGITVTSLGTKGLPNVYCDRVKVIEVLRNLVENAVVALPEGGEIRVGATYLMDAPAPMVQVAVEDDGEGIPEDVLPEVLEPFFTTRVKGTGLGLAIVKRIVEQHGGQIDVESVSGAGTTVRFTLPTEPADS